MFSAEPEVEMSSWLRPGPESLDPASRLVAIEPVGDPHPVPALLEAFGHHEFPGCAQRADRPGKVTVDCDDQAAEVGRPVGGDVVATQPDRQARAVKGQLQMCPIFGCLQVRLRGMTKPVRLPAPVASDPLFIESGNPIRCGYR